MNLINFKCIIGPAEVAVPRPEPFDPPGPETRQTPPFQKGDSRRAPQDVPETSVFDQADSVDHVELAAVLRPDLPLEPGRGPDRDALHPQRLHQDRPAGPEDDRRHSDRHRRAGNRPADPPELPFQRVFRRVHRAGDPERLRALLEPEGPRVPPFSVPADPLHRV